MATIFRRLFALAIIAVSVFSLNGEAGAAVITYEIFNHRDGGAIKNKDEPIASQAQTDADGYILRLKLNNTDFDGSDNSFNVNAAAPARGLTGSGIFQFDPNPANASFGGDLAKLTAFAFHNESGSNSTMFDAADDFYRIDVRLQAILFTDEAAAAPKWWGVNPQNVEFDDMLGALRSDANDPNTAAETSSNKSLDVARIYYEVVDLTLTPLSDGGGDGFLYSGPTQWDEFPNGATKPLFVQYCWRLGAGCETLAAAGWLEPFEDQTNLRAAPEDLLFQFGAKKIPEPGTLSILGAGLFGLALMRRKRRPV